MIQATARILSQEGREALTTNRVAEIAGVSIGSLYQYFPNREALVAELRRRYEEAFLERTLVAAARVGNLALPDAIRAFVEFMIGLHAEDPQLHNAISAEVPEWERKRLKQLALAFLEQHRGELRRKNLELAATVSLQAGEALMHDAAVRTPHLLNDEAFKEEVIDLLVRYLAR